MAWVVLGLMLLGLHHNSIEPIMVVEEEYQQSEYTLLDAIRAQEWQEKNK
jgi:hypothetical protein